LEKNPPAFAGQVGFGMPEKFRAAQQTRCLKEELEKSNVIDWLIEMYVL